MQENHRRKSFDLFITLLYYVNRISFTEQLHGQDVKQLPKLGTYRLK